jgi:RHS repeat-associated protein
MRTAGASGLSASYVTDEYGQSAAANTPRYGYLGAAQRSTDNPGGMITMGLRIYNPTAGRFLSIDPVYGGGANTYSYCSDDPVDCADTSGEWDYYLNYNFGYVPMPVAISGIFEKFRNSFSKYFPIPGAASRLTGVGQEMNLHPKALGVSLYFPVKVSKISSSATSAGWTFDTRFGHPDWPGFISFRLYRSGLNVVLTIHGNVPALTGAGVIAQAAYFRQAIATWAPLATSFASLIRPFK